MQFRHFHYQGIEDPQRVYKHLRELCYQWLKPERHTKEEILELLVLEQFLAIFPAEVKTWVSARDLQQGIQTMALIEEFLRSYQEARAKDQVNFNLSGMSTFGDLGWVGGWGERDQMTSRDNFLS